MKDFYENKKGKTTQRTPTMIGKIDRDLFYGLINIFFEQKAEAENEYYQYEQSHI